MKAQELSRKYAAAVFSLALEKWLIALHAVQEKLADNPDLAESLQDKDRSFSDRQKQLDQLFPDDIDQAVRNFLYTLVKNGDIGLLKQVLLDLELMAQSGPQVQVALVTTAIALADSEKEKFRQKLRRQYGDNLEFVFRVDPSILGGAIVQVGDKVIDGSVATRLEAMNNALGVKS
ncbi:MAG: ATP synthase F1 subunit delta [Chloroflexota bacterium]